MCHHVLHVLQVLASSFTANRATNGLGGALNLYRHVSSPGGSLVVAHSYFTSNTVGTSGGAGGGVSVDSSDFNSTIIRNTTFEGNEAAWGGGVYMTNCGGGLQVRPSYDQWSGLPCRLTAAVLLVGWLVCLVGSWVVLPLFSLIAVTPIVTRSRSVFTHELK